MFSTMVVGARMEFNFLHQQSVFSLNDDSLSLFPIGWIAHHPANLLLGLPFSLTLMFILFAHEMGHYLYARHYHVHATLPFFVPFPSLIGTLGAFIRIKSPIPSRAALFDIGVAGPIAGFIPACLALIYGLSLSHPVAGPGVSEIQLGFPLAFHLAARLIHIGSAALRTLTPSDRCGRVGWNVRHCAQPVTRRPARRWPHRIFHLSPPASLDFVAHGLRARATWKIYVDGLVSLAVLLALTLRHPPVSKFPEVTGGRRVLALCAAIMLILSFTPAPFTHSSGREVWPEIRDGARGTLHDLSNEIRHLMHRK